VVRNPGGQKQSLSVERFFSGEHQLDDPVREGIRSVVLPDGAWEVDHRDDRRIFLPLDLPGIGPTPTLARNDRAFGPIVVLHNAGVWSLALLKVSLLQIKVFPHGFKQVIGPGILFDPLPCLRPANGLHRLDTCLTTFAAIDKGLEHVNAMEDGSLIRRGSNHNRVSNRRISDEIYLGVAKVKLYRRPPAEGKVQLTGFVEHPLGVVPVVGEVLVVKNGYRAFALLENLDHLLIDPPTWQEPVPFEIGWIIPMFADDDDTIHRQFFPAKRDGFPDRFKDWNIFRFAYFLTQQARVELIYVNGYHIHPRRSGGAVPPITVDQLVYDPVRMGSRETPIANEAGDTKPFLRSLRNSIRCDPGQSR